MDARSPPSAAGIAIGLGLVGIAVVIFADTAYMRIPPSYARVGPQAFPFFVSVGLAVLGTYLIWSSWAPAASREIVSEEGPTDWRSLGLILLGLLLHWLLIKPLGFVLVSALLFVLVAIAFGSRFYLRDTAIGIILAAAAYLGFTRLLGLELPPGIFAGIL